MEYTNLMLISLYIYGLILCDSIAASREPKCMVNKTRVENWEPKTIAFTPNTATHDEPDELLRLLAEWPLKFLIHLREELQIAEDNVAALSELQRRSDKLLKKKKQSLGIPRKSSQMKKSPLRMDLDPLMPVMSLESLMYREEEIHNFRMPNQTMENGEPVSNTTMYYFITFTLLA